MECESKYTGTVFYDELDANFKWEFYVFNEVVRVHHTNTIVREHDAILMQLPPIQIDIVP